MVAEWVIDWKEKKNFSTRDDVKMFVEVAAPFLGYVLAVGVGWVVGRFVDGAKVFIGSTVPHLALLICKPFE